MHRVAVTAGEWELLLFTATQGRSGVASIDVGLAYSGPGGDSRSAEHSHDARYPSHTSSSERLAPQPSSWSGVSSWASAISPSRWPGQLPTLTIWRMGTFEPHCGQSRERVHRPSRGLRPVRATSVTRHDRCSRMGNLALFCCTARTVINCPTEEFTFCQPKRMHATPRVTTRRR